MESPEELVSSLEGYVKKLREESRNQQKLTDDTTAVRSFCQTVELILRHSLKERLSFWGERRDYWGYLSEGCAGNKALDPIIKHIQSSTLVATSQGKGRAFIRRCLSEHLLAECIQTTVNNVKKTKEWYVSGAVLLIPQLSQQVVVSLYDVGEIEFHLPLDGLDLDNTWPSFTIKSFQSPQRLPQSIAFPPPQSTPTRTLIPPPKAQVPTPLPSQPSPVELGVELGVESSGESTSSDSGQSSDHPVTTSPQVPTGFKISHQSPLATPSVTTVAMPTDEARPSSTTPSPLSTPSTSYTPTRGTVSTPNSTTLNVEELSDRSIVKEETGDQNSETGVETSLDWSTISALLGAILDLVKCHGNSNHGDQGPPPNNKTPPPDHIHVSNDSDMVVFLSSLKRYLESVLSSSDGRSHTLQEEVGHLRNHVRELEEELRVATASLERSRDLETRLLKANRSLQEQSVECEQLKEENRRLRDELNVSRATLPVQCDITIDTPTQTIRSEPDGNETGDLDQCRAQLATLQAEHGQCGSYQEELASLRKGRQQLEQEMATLRQEHQKTLREQDAQHQNAYTLLRDKMNEQLIGERRGRKMAEEELGERVRSLKENSELEVKSLKYQLSSQLISLEQSKEMYTRADRQLVDMKASNASLEKQVAELGAQATLREKALMSKTREWEVLQLSVAKMQSELKASREELTTLQMEKTAVRDKERVELLRFQTELDATKKQLLSEKKESSRLARENEEIRKMFAKLLEQKASLWQLADQLENEHINHEWVDSDRVVTCMACKEEFSLLNRKHHCRSCGKVFCGNCCSQKAMLASSKEPVRVCNACYKKHSIKSSRASEVINTLEESIASSPSTTATTIPTSMTTSNSRLIQPNAPPLFPVQHAESTNSLQRILLSQNSDSHISEVGEGLTGGILTPPRGASDSFIPDQLSSGPSSYTVQPTGRFSNGRDVGKAMPEEVGGAVPRRQEESTMAMRRAEDGVDKRPPGRALSDDTSREGAGSSGGGGGRSRAGKAGLVSYSLEDYDGLTKDDSYVVIETQSSGSMFPLGLDSHQGRLDMNALATKLASLEVADRDREVSTPVGRSLTRLTSDFKEVTLEGGACHKVTMTVETIGTVVGWEFSTEPKGLAFGITFCKDDRQEEVLPLRRCTSHKATLTGEYVVQKKGKYILNFDNCHSKYSGRLLRYKIWQNPPV